MKKMVIFQALVLLLLFLCNTAVLAEYTSVQDILVKEYQFENNEKLTNFIDYYGLTIDSLKDFEIIYLYNHFDDTKKNEIAEFMSYERRDSTFQWDKVKKLGIIHNDGSNITVIVLDKTSDSLYWGDGSLLHGSTEIVRKKLEISFDVFLKRMLDEYRVSSWEQYYPSTINDSTGWLFWKIAFQDEQNSIWQSSGAGSLADVIPNSLEDVVLSIMSLCKD